MSDEERDICPPIGDQIWIFIGLDVLFSVAALTILIYFVTLIHCNTAIKDAYSRLNIKYKRLIVICNISFLIVCISEIFINYFVYECHHRLIKIMEIICVTWYLLSLILLYTIFVYKIMDGLQGSLFQVSKKVEISFKFVIAILSFLLLSYVIIHSLNISPWLANMIWLLLMILYLFSCLYGGFIFVNKFTQMLVLYRRNESEYKGLITMMTRQTLLLTIALSSTLLVMLFTLIWSMIMYYNNYYLAITVVYVFEALINLICINLQFPHGREMYKLLCLKYIDCEVQFRLFVACLTKMIENIKTCHYSQCCSCCCCFCCCGCCKPNESNTNKDIGNNSNLKRDNNSSTDKCKINMSPNGTIMQTSENKNACDTGTDVAIDIDGNNYGELNCKQLDTSHVNV